jgi:hypothetical protein
MTDIMVTIDLIDLKALIIIEAGDAKETKKSVHKTLRIQRYQK